ncbi:MAG: ATP-binding cassette domain-containing protein [Mycobacteriales bacterium]
MTAGLVKRFGGSAALNRVAIEAQSGELVGVIGPNGAGKSTLVNVLTGVVRADAGTWAIDGTAMQEASSAQVARVGVARTFQTPRGSVDVSVLRNIALPVVRRHGGVLKGILEGKTGWKEGLPQALRAAQVCGLEGILDKQYRELTGGEARLVEIARVLASNPKIAYLDEPTAGLDVAKQDRVAEAIALLIDRGTTVFLVEHNLEFLMRIVSRVIVMAEGSVLAECAPSELRSDAGVRRVYFGEIDADTPPVKAPHIDLEVNDASGPRAVTKVRGDGASRPDGPSKPESALSARGLTGGYGRVEIIHNVSLEVAAGEAVAIAGANGAGKSTLLKLLSGVLPARSGDVFYQGRNVAHIDAQERNQLGLFHLPQEVVAFSKLTVGENLRLAARRGAGDPKGTDAVDEALDLFPFLRDVTRKLAGALSGGERQMLGLACAWASRCDLLLLDEPTSGLAPRIVLALTQTIQELLRRQRTVVWVVEQAPRTALEIVDRVYALVGGEVVFEGTPAKLGGPVGLAELVLGHPAAPPGG